jgi:hypothetical protein
VSAPRQLDETGVRLCPDYIGHHLDDRLITQRTQGQPSSSRVLELDERRAHAVRNLASPARVQPDNRNAPQTQRQRAHRRGAA